jgi:hypothetical protein
MQNSFNFMRHIARPISAVLAALIAIMPLSQAYATDMVWNSPAGEKGVLAPEVLKIVSDYLKLPPCDYQEVEDQRTGKSRPPFKCHDPAVVRNDATALMMNLPEALIPNKMIRGISGELQQVFARYDVASASGVIDVVSVKEMRTTEGDKAFVRVERIGKNNADALTSNVEGYCNNRDLVSSQPGVYPEVCENPMKDFEESLDTAGLPVMHNISMNAFFGLVGLVSATYNSGESWIMVAKSNIESWTTESGDLFSKKVTQHVKNYVTPEWYVNLPGVQTSGRKDIIYGGYCVSANDNPIDSNGNYIGDGKCDGAKVIPRTGFLKVGIGNDLPSDKQESCYCNKSSSGFTGVFAVVAIVAITVATGGAGALGASSLIGGAAGTASATALGALAVGVGYAAVSNIVSGGKGLDQIANDPLYMNDGAFSKTPNPFIVAGGNYYTTTDGSIVGRVDPRRLNLSHFNQSHYYLASARQVNPRGSGSWPNERPVNSAEEVVSSNNAVPRGDASVGGASSVPMRRLVDARMLKPSDFVIKQMAQSHELNRRGGIPRMTFSVNPIDDAKIKEGHAAQQERIKKLIKEMEESRRF